LVSAKERIIDWNQVYLLAWYGPDGKPYLTTWRDSEYTKTRYINVVVIGPDVQKWGPPIWDAPANCKPNKYGFPSHNYTEFQLHEVKEGEDAQKKARELGGVRAIGWCFEVPFERKWREEKSANPTGGEGKMNWFKRHPSLTVVFSHIVLILLDLLGIFIGSLFLDLLGILDSSTGAVLMWGGALFCLILSLVVLVWYLKRKNRSLWWLLLWHFVPFGVFFFLALEDKSRKQ